MSKVKNSRGRNWTPEELEVFALLLVDEENCFSDFRRLLEKDVLSSFTFSSLSRPLPHQ